MTEPEIIPPEAKAKQPIEFTDEIFAEVCERMANGQGLRKICEDPEMPSRYQFLRWVEKDTGRQAKYQAAREALMDWYAEEILVIAWDSSKDTIPADGKKPARCDSEWVNRSRLKVDTLKFLMAKLHPKRYGDKVPEVEAERDLKISWESSPKDTPVSIQRVILQGGAPATSHLQERIKELEAQLAEARGEKPAEPPKLLTFDPGPVPTRLHGQITTRLVDIIRSKVPDAANRDPASVLDEVMSIIDQALWAKYGYEQFEPEGDKVA